MKKTISWSIGILAALLPWHGSLTVFFPEQIRWWKEIILLVIFTTLAVQEFQNWKTKQLKKFSWAEVFALLFLFWGMTLALINGDKTTAFTALRYLGLGFFVFFVFSRLAKNNPDQKAIWLRNFSTIFVISCALSVLFGVWAQFFGGNEILQLFYSNTISSWVPGQSIPLFHKAGEIVRMQGGSSGPIEFSHLLVVALAMILFQKKIFPRTISSRQGLVYGTSFLVILFGIFQSLSRAAILGAMILFIFKIISLAITSGGKEKNADESSMSRSEGFRTLIKTIVMIFLAGGTLLWIRPDILQRMGTGDHFTRPIEALEMGMKNPVWGNLGLWGPAARARNMETQNTDQAPIAENVFLDYLTQLGILGFILAILFWGTAFWSTEAKWWGTFLVIILLMNFATIFDMTPLSIAIFGWLAFLQKTNKIAPLKIQKK